MVCQTASVGIVAQRLRCPAHIILLDLECKHLSRKQTYQSKAAFAFFLDKIRSNICRCIRGCPARMRSEPHRRFNLWLWQSLVATLAWQPQDLRVKWMPVMKSRDPFLRVLVSKAKGLCQAYCLESWMTATIWLRKTVIQRFFCLFDLQVRNDQRR